MSATNFTTADQAASALVNAASRQGVTPSTQLSAQQLPLSVLGNMLDGQIGGGLLNDGAAAGAIGTGGFATNGIVREGGLIKTTICVDLTGLASSATDLDIIGQGVSAAYLGRVTDEQNGVIIGGTMECLEVPAGGADDIDLYVASEGTGAFDVGIGTLTETAVVTSGAAWTLGRVLGTSPDAVINRSYLYLVAGEASAAGTYTAGRYLITLYGRAS
jgi:hypothetical protein